MLDAKSCIDEIEQIRGSRVVAYVTGDRPPIPAQIGDDALRPLREHLRNIGHVEKIDLFLYSRGGAIDVPWRIANSLRQGADSWDVLIPDHANSAATLLSLGADEIVMGRDGELGPIDPRLTIQRMVAAPNSPPVAVQDSIEVEDVMAFVEFAHDRIGLTEQSALTETLSKLTDRLDAIGLGNVYRTHRHIREVARKLLHSRKNLLNGEAIEAIVEILAERTYAHGHAISFVDAQVIGLNVSQANNDLDRAMLGLMNAYVKDLKLDEPIDPAVAVRGADIYVEPLSNAIIESTGMRHEFQGELEVRARRAPIAAGLNVSISVPISAEQLQQTFGPQANPATQQAAMQQLQQALLPTASQAVQDAIKARRLLPA
jgi:hypothetical protein